MTQPPQIADVITYLHASGWHPTEQVWRSARVWGRGDTEVLVPAHDGLGDNPARIHELLTAVGEVEGRSGADVARDVARPFLDTLVYRADGSRNPTLPEAAATVAGFRDLVRAAARAVWEGPHVRFPRPVPDAVATAVARFELEPTSGGLTALLPVDGAADVNGREVSLQLHDAAEAFLDAAAAADLQGFDAAVTAGVSTEFCTALAAMSEPGRVEPFSLTFRWAPGMRTEVPARTFAFAGETAAVARVVRKRLRRATVTAEAEVIGHADGLHDDPGTEDRWRVRVRGVMRIGGAGGLRRTVWVRLPGQGTYDQVVDAYRTGRPIRARGTLRTTNGRVELSAPAEGMEIMEQQEEEAGRG